MTIYKTKIGMNGADWVTNPVRRGREEKTSTLNSQPIEAFDIWLPQDPDQKILWSSTLRLDYRFMGTCMKVL